jgi:hypothetical protein
MKRVLLAIVIVQLAAIALLAFQFDVAGTIRKIDAGNGDLLIYVSGQDRSVKIDRDVKVLNTDGQPLTDGLNAKELKEGSGEDRAARRRRHAGNRRCDRTVT